MCTPYYEELAAKMLHLSVEDLPDSLLDVLKQVDRLVKTADPDKELYSAQIIALIVYQWQLEEDQLNNLFNGK